MRVLRVPARFLIVLLCWSCNGGPLFQCGKDAAKEPLYAGPPPAYMQKGLADYADTRRGSHAFRGQKPLVSYGNVFPATAVPFAFNLWTPVTDADTAWHYNFQRPSLTAFAVSHEPSTWMGDYGMLHLWPMVNASGSHPDARRVAFSHANETARPYQYSVTLDNGIRVDLAPTDHAAIFNIGYPVAPAYVLFDTVRGTSGGHFNVDWDKNEVLATISTDSPWSSPRTVYVVASIADASLENMQQATDRPLAISVKLTPKGAGPVVLRVATSWISLEQAHENLQREVAGRTFEEVRDAAQMAWDAELSRVHISGSNDEKTIYYSNLYRTYLYPSHRAETHEGASRYQSPYNNQVMAGDMWVNNGFWDTYRAEWPWLVLTRPQETGAMLDGFVRAYVEGGWTPRWSAPGYANLMTGTHTDAVFADAYGKGVRHFDVDKAYASAWQNATVAATDPNLGQGRNGLHRSMFLDYTPSDVEGESVAWHLEGCVNDFAIAQMANALGHADDAAFLYERAKTYVNLFSPEVGFFRGRKADGTWRTADADFRANDWSQEYTEGNAWHYAFPAPFDVQGMASLYGGHEALARKIDAMYAASPVNVTSYYDSVIHEMQEATACNMGQYGHSNETVHHIPYLYNYLGQPWKTQKRVRDVLDPNRGLYTLGTADGTGWLGDEDNGQMSAWFVFSALGFYPAVGAPEYVIGSPLYKEATLYLENGKHFTVQAPTNSHTNIYIQSATLNGNALTRPYITHDEISAGGVLLLTMGAAPSNWGADLQQAPHSMSKGGSAPHPMADKAKGGAAFTYGNTLSPEQDAAAAFDNNAKTAWGVRNSDGTLGYSFSKDAPTTLAWYTVTSTMNDPACDPVMWTLEGTADGTHWTTLDTRERQIFSHRLETRMYRAAVNTPQKSLRLNFKSAASACLQVAEVEFVAP